MVYLTVTSTILEALEKVQSLESLAKEKHRLRDGKDVEEGLESRSKAAAPGTAAEDEKQSGASVSTEDGDTKKDSQSKSKSEVVDASGTSIEPSLFNPKLGNPISHSQIIDLSMELKKYSLSFWSLDALLRGSRVYVAPPNAKPEPVSPNPPPCKHDLIFPQTSEYKALMARLRREEEARSYERMVNPPPPMETFAQRFPMSSAAHAFPSYQEPEPEDEVTYAEINRQMALIFNVLISIVACAGAIWVAARWWSTPARLALSMSGSLLVGVAEVVVYGGYIRRVGEAKGKEKGVKEVKEVLRTWVVGGGEDEDIRDTKESILLEEKQDLGDTRARRRKKETS
jgi:hypothetical protein